MNEEQILKIEQSIEDLKNKKSKIYFVIQDTKGNPKASIEYIYEMALTLKENGFNSVMLTEEIEYGGVSSWLGDKYNDLPVISFKKGDLQIKPSDFIVVPELFGFVMPQIKNVPCGKIVLCQSYDNMLETLQPGETWAQFGFFKCIVTSDELKDYVQQTMKHVTFDVIPPVISNEFKHNSLPPKTIVSIHSKEQRDTISLIKLFYLKYPQYRWVTLKDMRGLSKTEFSTRLSESFVSVWIDEMSSYGTFPLESMKSNVPVIGLVPNILPNWINEDNGIWVNNKNHIVDVLADFVQKWIEDNISDELYQKMGETVNTLPVSESVKETMVSLFDEYLKTRLTSFEEQLNKLSTIEE